MLRYTICPPEHVDSEMDRLVTMHAGHASRGIAGDVQAAWFHHRFTQIHPFQDGNGRVARAIASLLLVRNGLFPLVVTRDDKPAYIGALEVADNGNLKPLVDFIAHLQVTWFGKASAISEGSLVEGDVQAALEGLQKAADKTAADRLDTLRQVFDHARVVEQDLENRLNAVSSEVEAALQKVLESARVYVRRATSDTGHHFRAQIIENAKRHIGYFADTSEYRSWVSLSMRWMRRAQLVFALHGIGKPFNGSLVCAPFLEFRDTGEDGDVNATFVPVTDEGFVFFYNEDREKLMARFRPWRENVLKVALSELTRNL